MSNQDASHAPGWIKTGEAAGPDGERIELGHLDGVRVTPQRGEQIAEALRPFVDEARRWTMPPPDYARVIGCVALTYGDIKRLALLAQQETPSPASDYSTTDDTARWLDAEDAETPEGTK
jgi:hypothetical protein